MDDYFSCVSRDGAFMCGKVEVFQCPRCFRTQTLPVLRTYQPNMICNCEYPHSMTYIVSLGVQCPPGYVEKPVTEKIDSQAHNKNEVLKLGRGRVF